MKLKINFQLERLKINVNFVTYISPLKAMNRQ